LHSPNPAPSSPLLTLDVRLADINIRIEAPERVLDVLGATLSVVPRFEAHAVPELTISVQRKDDVWEIHGLAGSLKVLAAQSAMPQIGGAVVTSAIHDAAASRNYKTMRATVVEKDGRALAMIGDDWESAITLAAHLHGRGWSFIGSDNALLDSATLEVFPIQKSLYVNSSSVAQFPIHYRRAVEASPWYVTAQGISFYAVDPRRAGHRQTWAHSAVLAGVIVVDGSMTERPSIESVDSLSLQSERFARLGVDWKRVKAVDLKLGGFVDTCDLVEHWFGSIPE
jgi:hypothetical protein